MAKRILASDCVYSHSHATKYWQRTWYRHTIEQLNQKLRAFLPS